MKQENLKRRRAVVPEDPDSTLDKDERDRVAAAMLRGLKRTGRSEFTEIDLWSALFWAQRTKIRAVVLDLLLRGMVDMIPSADGDPEKIVFAAGPSRSDDR